MATQREIADAAAEFLRARGYVSDMHAPVTEVANAIQGMLRGESQPTLERKLRKVAAIRRYGFKAEGDQVSVAER